MTYQTAEDDRIKKACSASARAALGLAAMASLATMVEKECQSNERKEGSVFLGLGLVTRENMNIEYQVQRYQGT